MLTPEEIKDLFRRTPSNLTVCHDLMRFRVREILLVASVYDAYIIEREGQLMEQIYGEYYQLNLSTAPRVTAVHSPEETMEALRERRYDMVIIMIGIDRWMPLELAARLRDAVPEIPILLLFNNHTDIALHAYAPEELTNIDRLFVWNGDPSIFLAMIKSVEDSLNVGPDTRLAAIRVILLVEDSIRYYSRYLPVLYRVLLQDMQKLIAGEDIDARFKILRMRARPKILLATSWEEAEALYRRYREFLLCIISDIEFPREGRIDPEAGFSFSRLVHQESDLPVLLQSADDSFSARAEAEGSLFINKTSPTILKELGRFFEEHLGFGNFVFRDAAGNKLIEARYMSELTALVATVPDETIRYHASRHHFARWLMAKGEVETARLLREMTIEQFPDGTAGVRRTLLRILEEKRLERTRGGMAGFTESLLAERFFFMRLASGSVGGKGRGLSFIEYVLSRADLDRHLPGIAVRLPRTAIIGTDEFHLFTERIGLPHILALEEETEIKRLFLSKPLSPAIRERLRALLRVMRGPIAVRSSGLFEDSLSQPFAGIYETYFLPNNHPDEAVRLRQLEEAIRLVFASVYLPEARAYFEAAHCEIEEEKMAVVIQEVVGRRSGDLFYPHVSGVAQSYNYYPFGKMKPEDGVALLAIGLGKAVVDGEQVFRFCPRWPRARNQSLQELLDSSQRFFYAIDLRKNDISLLAGEKATLARIEIVETEGEESLESCFSTFDPAQQSKHPGRSLSGPRIVDFATILEYNRPPLAEALRTVLPIMSHAFSTPVEIEFALDLSEENAEAPTLSLLQVKPLVHNTREHRIDLEALSREDLLLSTTRAMGNGTIEDIRDIIYLNPEHFDRTKTEAMAAEIAAFNKMLKRENRHYLLIGPGRWGSSDRFLGIPVDWNAISHARAIVEVGLPDFVIEPSLGSHFFHNITSLNIGYFTIDPADATHFIDLRYLMNLPRVASGTFAHLCRSEHPLLVRMDGIRGIAVVEKPQR